MWFYHDKKIQSHSDLLPECTDFVYLITYVDGSKYIGKKTVRSLRRLKPTKKQLAIRKNFVRKEVVELPFVDYEGSHNLGGVPKIQKKEILYQCSQTRTATYIETALLFEHNAVMTDRYHNKSINGKFFDNALDGLL